MLSDLTAVDVFDEIVFFFFFSSSYLVPCDTVNNVFINLNSTLLVQFEHFLSANRVHAGTAPTLEVRTDLT